MSTPDIRAAKAKQSKAKQAKTASTLTQASDRACEKKRRLVPRAPYLRPRRAHVELRRRGEK